MICCFTGHRSIAPNQMAQLPDIIDKEIERLIAEGVTVFRGGGALGFDTLAELKVLEKKEKYSFLKLELILPCRDQTSNWNPRNKEIYVYIASRADSVEYVSDKYTPTCMHERNRRLVNGSDFCLAYCTSDSGGTAYTCSYARGQGVKVINVENMIN